MAGVRPDESGRYAPSNRSARCRRAFGPRAGCLRPLSRARLLDHLEERWHHRRGESQFDVSQPVLQFNHPDYSTKSCKSVSVNTAYAAANRNFNRGAYSSDSYQACASARLGNSISTGKLGDQSPSLYSHSSPAIRYLPPYCLTVARTPSRYSSMVSGSVTS